MKGIIDPYPPQWPRTLDFLSPLRLQTKVDPKLELYCFDGEVSFSAGASTRELSKIPETTELGVKIDRTLSSANRIRVHFGDVLPNTDELRSQSEILKDVEDSSEIEVPDIVTKMRGAVEKIPPGLEEVESVQGSEYVFYEEGNRGNRTKSLRTMLNMQELRNPHEFIKGDLLKFGAVKSLKDPSVRRMRGIQKN